MRDYEPNKYQGFMYSAYKDILALEALGEFGGIHYEAMAFHAQQAAEKMLKNALTENGIVPPKTHNIDDLLTIAKENRILAPEKQDIIAAVQLSQYAVKIRYSQIPDIQAGEVISAIKNCNQISKMLDKAGFESIKIETPKSLIKTPSLAERASISKEVSEGLRENSDIDLNKDNKKEDRGL